MALLDRIAYGIYYILQVDEWFWARFTIGKEGEANMIL